MELVIQTIDNVSDQLLDVLTYLETSIFDQPYSREKIEREADSKQKFTCLVAYEGDKPCGFKAGYEMTSRLYYSWIGGVHPEFRRRGIAQKLMDEQHVMIKKLGYEAVRTHTRNRFRDMLLLNIKNGFDVTGVFLDGDSSSPTIVLEKSLCGDL